MLIGHRKSIQRFRSNREHRLLRRFFHCVSSNIRFSHAVGDLLAAFILRQVIKHMAPRHSVDFLVFLRQRESRCLCRRPGSNLLHQLNRHRCGPHAILIVLVVPDLHNRHLHLFRNMLVGQYRYKCKSFFRILLRHSVDPQFFRIVLGISEFFDPAILVTVAVFVHLQLAKHHVHPFVLLRKYDPVVLYMFIIFQSD